jgi:F-type H+-transporting ATPase subunit delta
MAEKVTHESSFDSDRQHLGDLYAKGLVAALEKAGTTDEALEQFESAIQDVWNQHRTLGDVMSSPRIAFAEKERLLDRIFEGHMDPLLLNFLKVVAQHNRMNCLRAMQRSAQALLNEMRGRREVVVETAIALDDGLRQEVVEQLKSLLASDVILEERVNPTLLGGIRVRVGDTVYDGTISNRLKVLSEKVTDQLSRTVREKPRRFATA